MHDYMNGHTCPSCGKSGIICTIEDGFCENEGTCDECIKENYKDEDDWLYSPDYEIEHDYDEDCTCDDCQDERNYNANVQ